MGSGSCFLEGRIIVGAIYNSNLEFSKHSGEVPLHRDIPLGMDRPPFLVPTSCFVLTRPACPARKFVRKWRRFPSKVGYACVYTPGGCGSRLRDWPDPDLTIKKNRSGSDPQEKPDPYKIFDYRGIFGFVLKLDPTRITSKNRIQPNPDPDP